MQLVMLSAAKHLSLNDGYHKLAAQILRFAANDKGVVLWAN